MAHTKVTKNGSQNTGTANTFSYSGSFDVFKSTEVKVDLDSVTLTYTASTINESASPREYTVDITAKTVHIGGADLSASNSLVIRPFTDMGAPTPRATYTPGASITSDDLNNNQLQLMRKAMEYDEQKLSSTGGTMTGDLTMGEDTTLIFEGATDNAYETTLTVADPTADRTITVPNVTGTVVTTGDTGTVAHAMLAGDAVDGDNIADDSVNSEHIVDGSIDLAHMSANSVDSDQYVDGSIDHIHLAADVIDGDNIQDDVINSEHIAAGAIDLEHMSANSVDSDQYVDGSIDLAHMSANSVDSDQYVDGSIDHVHLAADAVDGDNIADDSINSEHYVAGSIDNEHLADDAVGADELAANAVVNDSIAAGAAIAHSKLANITDGQILVGNGSNVPTAVAVSGDITIANTGAVTIANDAVEIGMIGCEQTTISDSDSHIPTSGAVVDYVAAQLAPIGGLEVIADDESFPNTVPSAGVVISITDAAGLQVNSSGVSTNGDTLDNSTVTINGFPSELRGGVGSNADPYVFQSGAGLMVQSTGSSHTYNYHQAMIREADFVQLSDDINDFNNRYRISAGEPGSNNDTGDLVFDTNASKMKVYDGSSWGEVTSTGDFKYLFLCPAGGTGAPTINGSIATYDLRESSNSGSAASVTSAAQLIVSVNGVIQKANTGTSAPAEGFALVDANTIIFGSNLPTGASVFIVQVGSAVSIPTPGDGTVSAAKIAAGAVIAAKIGTGAVEHAKLANDAVDGDNIADDAINSEHYVDASIDHQHLANDCVDGDNIADDAINSEHYVDASIDHAHLSNDCIDGDNIQDDVINSEHIAAGAIDLEHMSSQSVDEDNLYISNAGTNGQFLSKQSGNDGGLTWADATTDFASLSDTTVSTSDPSGTTNPGATGHLWVNKNSGECYVCTDATSNNNVWTNIGDGTGAKGNYSVNFLVVAGGGGGGSAYGGGGGAGGMRASYNNETSGGGGSSESATSLSRGVQYTITVGAGGSGGTWGANGGDGDHGDDGGDSSISGSGYTTLTSVGGGGGGGRNYATPNNGNGRNGGCGGGGSDGNGGSHGSGGTGTANQGYDGAAGNIDYDGGGGGGTGQAGDTPGGNGDAGDGGNGTASTITGSSITYGGGGGGAQRKNASNGGLNGDGGSGGGGHGALANGTAPTNGGGNQGGGGGGGGDTTNQDGANGGTGRVVLRMATADYSGTTTGSPNVSTSGSDTILRFDSSGTYTA